MMTAYWRRINAERLSMQAPNVRAAAGELLKELEGVQDCLYWALDPADAAVQWADSVIEHAHRLIDLGYGYRDALRANPPPKPLDEDYA